MSGLPQPERGGVRYVTSRNWSHRMKKAVLIVVVLALLAVGGWVGWQRLYPAPQQA